MPGFSSSDFRKQFGLEKRTAQNDASAQVPDGEFSSRGWIAPAMARPAWRVSAPFDVSEPGPGFITRIPMGHWGYGYYFDTQKEANEFAKSLPEDDQGRRRFSQYVWRIDFNTVDVINSRDLKSLVQSFGASIGGECFITAWGSRKYRHEFMLVQTAWVAAASRLFDDVPDQVFDLSGLLDRNRSYTDAYFAKLLGDPDVNPDEPGGLLEGELMRQRAEIWAAFGESDPLKRKPAAVDDQGNVLPAEEQKDSMTLSPALGAALDMLYTPWPRPIWVRFQYVFDPRVDATYTRTSTNDQGEQTEETRRQRLPVIEDFWLSAEDAYAAADAEAVEFGLEYDRDKGSAASKLQEQSVIAPTSVPGFEYPVVPLAYAQASYDGATFHALITGDAYANMSDDEVAADLGLTPEIVNMWRAL